MEFEPTDLLPAPEQWGHIRLLEKVGEGSFGDVYRGWETRLECEVAVKLLKPGGRKSEAWIEEARKLAKLQHPGILRVFGAEQFNGRPGIWTEFIQGETLSQALDTKGVHSEREAAGIILDVGAALAAVHSAGMVHRDVKCQNVMRDTRGRIVLMDLGAASQFEPDASDGIAGTPHYMAPEVLRGDHATPLSDLYSLGVVLFRLLTGKYPVSGTTARELIRLHGEGTRLHLRDLRPDLSFEFAALVERLLERAPLDRFQTVGELERALQSVLGATPHGVSSSKDSGKNKWIPLTLVAIALVASLTFLVNFREFGDLRLLRANSADGIFAEMEVTFHRWQNNKLEALASDSTVEVGDQIFAELSCRDSVWAYVLNEDASGQTRLVFPIAGSETQNPLPPTDSQHLPGTSSGRPIYWKISSESQTEDFLVIATRKRSEELERELYALSTPSGQVNGDFALGTPDKERMRGVGEVVVGAESLSNGSLIESLRRTATGGGSDAGVWTFHVSFRHPGANGLEEGRAP